MKECLIHFPPALLSRYMNEPEQRDSTPYTFTARVDLIIQYFLFVFHK